MTSARINPNLRSGLSLLEVMIVLVIMVGITAIVWPNLQKKLQRNSLNESAAMVRELLNETRYRASEDGQSYVVRLETGSSELSVGSVDQFWGDSSEFNELTNAAFGRDSGSRDIPEDGLTLKVLPESVVVSDVQWSNSSLEGQSPTEADSLPVSTGTVVNNADIVVDTESENESLESMPSQAYWLPILAGIGQGRDVKITLTDTSAQESIGVNYCAATGAIEVSR